MKYSMKQVRYSGVQDGHTSHNQAHTLTQADSQDETQGIPVGTILFDCLVNMSMDQPTLRYRLPDHLSQFHQHISYVKVNSHSSLNRLSQVYLPIIVRVL
jgi:hypothetical protein